MWRTYPTRFGMALDEFLNVALFNGDVGITISEHSARAALAKKPWGCVMCWLLSHLVDRCHCSKVLAGVTTGHGAALRAFILMLLACALLWWTTEFSFHSIAAAF